MRHAAAPAPAPNAPGARVSLATFWLLVGAALVVDIVQVAVQLLNALPIFGFAIAAVLGFFISINAFIAFQLIFILLGVRGSALRVRGMLRLLAVVLVEVVPLPLLSVLPLYTAYVYFTLRDARKEYKKYNEYDAPA